MIPTLFATTFFIGILRVFFAIVIIFFGYMCWKTVMKSFDYDTTRVFTLKVAVCWLILICIANLFKVFINMLI
jgi:hypothetical protein